MKIGPDISLIGSLIGDPARANMLVALLSGKALTATELSNAAGITAQTASSHLAKLEDGGLVTRLKQGRHHYFLLKDDDVLAFLENVIGLADRKGHMRTRTGPKEPELRKARVCYNHMAGTYGVRVLDSLLQRNIVTLKGDKMTPSSDSDQFFSILGIDFETLKSTRTPLCKPCLDWSVRRNHLAGTLGNALLECFYSQNWIKRIENTRILKITPKGETQFNLHFPI